MIARFLDEVELLKKSEQLLCLIFTLKLAQDLLMAKTGILLASLLAGISGFLWLYFTATKNTAETSSEE
jgi:hypothetical protein